MRLNVNGNPVRPWDPFLQNARFIQRLPAEEIPISGHGIRVAGFVLPAPALSQRRGSAAGRRPAGWLEQQGFYVYRRDRLILAGDWLGIRGFRKEDKYILARVAVDIPAELDPSGASTCVSPPPCRHWRRAPTCSGSAPPPGAPPPPC